MGEIYLMKILVMAGLILCSISSVAQGERQMQRRADKSVEQRAEERATTLKVKLKLNDQQYSSLYNILLGNMKKDEVIRAEMKRRHEESDAQIKNVFTPDQFAECEKMKENMRSRMKNRQEPEETK